MPERLPLILDVDTGIDDSLALLYACASPDASLPTSTRTVRSTRMRMNAPSSSPR